MMDMTAMHEQFGISKNMLDFEWEIEEQSQSRSRGIGRTAEYNQMKALKAMQDNRISDVHSAATTSCGYDDSGRDTLEGMYTSIFYGENALVHPQLISGIHTLHVALSGNLRPEDKLLSPTGKPYDTLEKVIDIRDSVGSLKEYNVVHRQVDLLPNKAFDCDNIAKTINEKTKLVTIQHSKGYGTRPTFSVTQIGELIALVKKIRPEVVCMMDNCYEESVKTIEPTDVGMDMIVGSLIKNPGGSLVPIGGYTMGRKDCVDRASYRLSAPRLGREVGVGLGFNQSFFQGLFLSPTVTIGALKGAILAASVYEKLGFAMVLNSTKSHHDIIQAVTFGTPESVTAFCQGVQAAALVDSYVGPESWDMPGYDAPVIMAAGAFVQGSLTELSAGGPVRPLYATYLQGGLTWCHTRLGISMFLQRLVDANIVLLQITHTDGTTYGKLMLFCLRDII